MFIRILSLALLLAAQVWSQNISNAFENIRKNEAMLQHFFSQMPKGGDLHNHLTGSVYPETYFNIALQDSMYLDTLTYILYQKNDASRPKSTKQLKPKMEKEHLYRVRCIDNWSVRNFNPAKQELPPDEFFFDTFGRFGGATSDKYIEMFVKELKLRAEAENVQFIEIMATSPRVYKSFKDDKTKNLIEFIKNKDEAKFNGTLDSLFGKFEKNDSLQQEIRRYVTFTDSLDIKTKGVAPSVRAFFIAYISRNVEDPAKVFAQLYLAFKSNAASDKLLGVNIVQAENGDYSLRDYWGHMQMFKYLRGKVLKGKDTVKTTMHAGELALGLTPPEDLKFHIDDAVNVAKANRIGHGVDIAFEKNSSAVLSKMAKEKIAVEINLTSNEFILGVKGGEHPIMLYHKNKVPLVLSTDDAGILRTNLTQQFTLAALRYPELKYKDFAQFVMNSIEYSFMPKAAKDSVMTDVKKRLADFENTNSK